jgi:hypothetical protein
LQHLISVSGERDYSVTGAVTLTSRQPVIDAASALVASGAAKPSDTIRVDWREGTPFQVNINRVLGYRPSLAAQSVGRSGKILHHMGAQSARGQL